MTTVDVVLAWQSTGQVCNERGERITHGDQDFQRFTARNEAEEFVTNTLRMYPFLEAYIKPLDDSKESARIAHSMDRPEQLPSHDSYRVLLFEWMSYAALDQNARYLQHGEPTPNLLFPDLTSASQFSDAIAESYPNIVPWIYAPDGCLLENSPRTLSLIHI